MTVLVKQSAISWLSWWSSLTQNDSRPFHDCPGEAVLTQNDSWRPFYDSVLVKQCKPGSFQRELLWIRRSSHSCWARGRYESGNDAETSSEVRESWACWVSEPSWQAAWTSMLSKLLRLPAAWSTWVILGPGGWRKGQRQEEEILALLTLNLI